MPGKRGKQPASTRRAALPRRSDYTRQFARDWERLDGSGRFNMARLKEVMTLLVANDAPLGPEWRDHALNGEWHDHRECHVGGDFLLIYTIDDGQNLVVFTRAGTHSDLFR